MLRVLLYLLIVAALIYAVFWSINRRNAGPDPQSPRARPHPPRGPLGPDDDEDFLRELDRKRKHRPDEKG